MGITIKVWIALPLDWLRTLSALPKNLKKLGEFVKILVFKY
jgi:hypothetical protein